MSQRFNQQMTGDASAHVVFMSRFVAGGESSVLLVRVAGTGTIGHSESGTVTLHDVHFNIIIKHTAAT
jgi:hypothetical protein